MKTHGLIGRISKGSTHHPWASRDYQHINCKATGCRWNINEECGVPSRCAMGEDGRCKGFEVPPMKTKVDGD